MSDRGEENDESDEGFKVTLPTAGGDGMVFLEYTVVVEFHPKIRMSRAAGLSFASTLRGIEIASADVSDNAWTYNGSGACEGMQLTITPSKLKLAVVNSTQLDNCLEWYEERYREIAECFFDAFKPSYLLECRVHCISKLALINAMPFLGGWVLTLHPSQLDPINRDLHLLGVRFYFPETQGDNGKDWSVDARIETTVGEEMLGFTAIGIWDTPTPWRDDLSQEIISRLKVIEDFIKVELINFLRTGPAQPPSNEEE